MTIEPTPDARTRILDAAERAFADHGLAGARVAAIAADAAVNKAMLYYYFDSKEALHGAVIERVFEQILAMIAEIDPEGDGPPEKTLEAFLRGYAGVLSQHPHFVRLMLRSALDGHDGILAIAGPRVASVVPRIAGVLARGQARGHLNPDADPLLTPPLMVASAVFFALARPLLERVSGTPGDALAARWNDNVLQVLMYGLLARPQEGR